MIDILITLLLAVPLTAFLTLYIAAVGRINWENEIYTEGFNDGYTKGYNAGTKAGGEDDRIGSN